MLPIRYYSKYINLSTMTLNEYQQRAMTTRTASCDNEAYMLLNLVGELGELASKMAKAIRKEKAVFHDNRFIPHYNGQGLTLEEMEDMKSEVGDIAWQLAGLCSVMGWTLEEVCQENLDKLASRKERGVIIGDGDRR